MSSKGNSQDYDALCNKIEILEKLFYEFQLKNKDEYHDLERLVSKAVKDGNNDVLDKIEEIEKRVVALENKDGKQAKTILVAIGTTSLGWLVLGILNNLPAILGLFNK